MNYKHVHVIYFSPTHTSAKIAHAIVEGMGAVSFSESDLTYEMPGSEEVVERELTGLIKKRSRRHLLLSW